jgi:hypothetical protein
MQKFVDQAISANTHYDPSLFKGNKVPMKLFLMDLLKVVTKARGGSMPLVEFEICDELSQGINAVRVEFLKPSFLIFLRSPSQS